MTRSEIDDIFASKPKKGSSVQPVAAVGTTPPQKKKKRKRQPDLDEKPQKRLVPETIVDPSSSSLPLPAPKINSDKKLSSAALVVKDKDRKKDREALQQFKDSRGTGPRRKTDEGFAIYKEAELHINVETGGTPLCPFDCDCCF